MREEVSWMIRFISIILMWGSLVNAVDALAGDYSSYKSWPKDIKVKSKVQRLKYYKITKRANEIMEHHFKGVPRNRVIYSLHYADPKKCKELLMKKGRKKYEKEHAECHSLAVCITNSNRKLSNKIIFFIDRAPEYSFNQWVLTAIHEIIHCRYGISHIEGTIMGRTADNDHIFLTRYKGDVGPFIEEIEIMFRRGTAPMISDDR